MADESGSNAGQPVRRKILNRLTQEQVGKLVAYIIPRKPEFTGKMCAEIAKVCAQDLGFRITRDNIHSVAKYADLQVSEPGKGKTHFALRLSNELKEQGEAIEQLKIKIKLMEETLQAHANVPSDIKDLFKNDIEAGSRIELILKRLNLTIPVKPI